MTARPAATMPKFDISSETFGAYTQKVNNLEQSMAQLAHTVDRGFDQIRSENKAAIDSVSISISNLSAKFDARSGPQYSLMVGVGMFILAIMGGLGAIVYVPLKNSVDNTATKLDTEIGRAASHEEIAGRTVDLKNIIDQRLDESGARRDDWQRQAEDRDKNLASEVDKMMPRSEEELRWKWIDKQLDDMRMTKPKG